jgi:curved DNA-binding protein CbpA
MTTLYDLLGALPHDDAEALRTAFRRAVKGAHPDIRPGDPSAALRFRQIMRANQILGDADERAAYDHLLELARAEQVSASKHAVAATIHKLASGVLALAGASAATVGGYLLFIHISAASVDHLDNLDARATAEIAALSSAASSSDTTGLSISLARYESASIPTEAVAPSAAAVTHSDAESIRPADVGPPLATAASEARSLRARGMTAYRNGDLKRAIADLDHALRLDPKFLPAYIDRGIISYRQRKFGRAYADLARPRRPEKATHSKSAPAKRPRIAQAGVPTSMAWSQPRTATQDPSHGDGFTSVMH